MSPTATDIATQGGKAIFNSFLWKAVIRFRREAKRRKKYALLIGIGYTNSSARWRLDGIENDLSAMEDLLIQHYGYKKKNIVILSDKCEQEECTNPSLLPTRDNVMREVKRLVRSSVAADYFFMFSGHSENRKDPEVPSKEWDSREEYMLPCDAFQTVEGGEDIIDENKIITDKDLHYWLVNRLQLVNNGSRLFGIMDSCHSGTLLNLVHRRCNEAGNSVKTRVREFIRRVIIEPIYHTATGMAYIERIKNVNLGRKWTDCFGLCKLPSTTEEMQPQVVCISACRDNQSVVNVPNGGVLIQKFVELMGTPTETPVTYRQLMTALREASREFAFFVIHNYKFSESFWLRFKQKRSLRSDPQLSSNEPLNMDLKIEL